MRRRFQRRLFSRGGISVAVVAGLIAFTAWKLNWLPMQSVDPESGRLADSELSDAPEFSDEPVVLDPVLFSGQSEPAVDTTADGNVRGQTGDHQQHAAGNSTLSQQWDDPPTPNVPTNLPVPGGARTADGQTNGGVVQASAQADQQKPPVRSTRAILNEVDVLIQDGDYVAAHRDLSKLYWNQPQLRNTIKKRIETTAKSIYFSPQPHYLAAYEVQANDQLRRIARNYHVPWQYLARLNRVEPRKIRVGQKLKVIKGPFSAVIDLGAFEITIHNKGYFVCKFPVGIGKEGTTPVGKYTVLGKQFNPTYYGPNGNVVDMDDPANPLGERWIDIGNGYGLHGTIDPKSIGKAQSRGCIRLKNDDVDVVYDLLEIGSEVIIRR